MHCICKPHKAGFGGHGLEGHVEQRRCIFTLQAYYLDLQVPLGARIAVLGTSGVRSLRRFPWGEDELLQHVAHRSIVQWLSGWEDFSLECRCWSSSAVGRWFCAQDCSAQSSHGNLAAHCVLSKRTPSALMLPSAAWIFPGSLLGA